jgi:hypothetical protein
MHAFGIGIGQERKVKRSKLGWRTGFSMTFMRNGFFYRGVDICIKINLRIHMRGGATRARKYQNVSLFRRDDNYLIQCREGEA